MEFKFIKKALLHLFLGTHRISPRWYLKIKFLCFFSKKIKVGFGPVATGEDDLAERKWRIDPIIDEINRANRKFISGFFVHPNEMKKFDILIIVKKFNPEWIRAIQKLKNKKIIYDIVDNPNDEPRYRFYFRDYPEFLDRIDGFILSSPLHTLQLKSDKTPKLLIEHPIIHSLYKTKYESGSEIRILAQGYRENLLNLRRIEPLLPKISASIGKPVRLYYHTNEPFVDSEWARSVRWSVKNCFEEMIRADMAITMKDLNKLHQHTKPSTKIIAYMAAGLPVICKPTAADRLVMEHRVTGFFAYREEDWIRWITLLCKQTSLRRQIGRAARASVVQKYSVKKIVEKYFSLLEHL